MTELTVVRDAREAAKQRHPAYSQRAQRFECVICSGDLAFQCDCIASLLDGYESTEERIRRIARDELDQCFDELADHVLANMGQA